MFYDIFTPNTNLVYIYFNNRAPLIIVTDDGTARKLAEELLTPFNWIYEADTQVIELKEAI